MASAGMTHVGHGQEDRRFGPRAFHFAFQAEDAFLPVRAALNVETCQLQSTIAPAALPTSEMAWENRFIMVGHNRDGPAPVPDMPSSVPRCAAHATFKFLVAIAVGFCFVYHVSRRHVLLCVFIIMCRDPTHRDTPSTTAVCFSFLFSGSGS
jgi:hypothetical protein